MRTATTAEASRARPLAAHVALRSQDIEPVVQLLGDGRTGAPGHAAAAQCGSEQLVENVPRVGTQEGTGAARAQAFDIGSEHRQKTLVPTNGSARTCNGAFTNVRCRSASGVRTTGKRRLGTGRPSSAIGGCLGLASLVSCAAALTGAESATVGCRTFCNFRSALRIYRCGVQN